jgi:hypothetical protein
MNFIETLIMLFRWKDHGWEVHPIVDSEFQGWI